MKKSGKFPSYKANKDRRELEQIRNEKKTDSERAQDKYEHYKFDDNESEDKKKYKTAYDEAKEEYVKAEREYGERLADDFHKKQTARNIDGARSSISIESKYGRKRLVTQKDYETNREALNVITKQYTQEKDPKQKAVLGRVMENYRKNLNQYETAQSAKRQEFLKATINRYDKKINEADNVVDKQYYLHKKRKLDMELDELKKVTTPKVHKK